MWGNRRFLPHLSEADVPPAGGWLPSEASSNQIKKAPVWVACLCGCGGWPWPNDLRVMSCGLYAVGRHSGGFPALWTRKTTLSGPVCSTGSMDSDSRMGQGLGQNPEKPEGHFSSGNSLSESRERNFSPTPGKSRTRENQRSEKAHLKPAPLTCVRLSQLG